MRTNNFFDLPTYHYHTLLADPPWSEAGGGKIRRGADRHYSLMKTRDIVSLGALIKRLSTADCHLYLWTTNNHLPDALEVMAAWGFKYKTMITWVKDRFGLGQYFRGITEHCLFGVCGVLPYKIKDGKRQQGVTVIQAPKTGHSIKPTEMYNMIERVSYPPYIELFARTEHPGWDSWGNEV